MLLLDICRTFFVFYGSYDLFQQCFHGLHTINVCDCVRVVQENNILNILFSDKLVKAAFEFRIFGKIPVIHNINMLIMIHQEWNKGVAVGFLHNSTGRAIIKGWGCQYRQMVHRRQQRHCILMQSHIRIHR